VRSRLARISLAALVSVGAGLGIRAVSRPDTPPAGTITNAVMEDRYGVRIDLLGLAALGGLLELRFTVLDKDKAEVLFHDLKPDVLVESTGVVLHPPVDSAHKMVLLDGASYFLLYANAGNSLHGGDKVSVVVGQVRLEHLVVKS
jgi:hypothetical protein